MHEHLPTVSQKGKFEVLVQNYEKQLIVEALKETWGNQTEAAKALGTTKRVIQYKINKLNINYKLFSHHNKKG
jgi:Nif-specific regulatory protein